MNGMQVGGYPAIHQPRGFVFIYYLSNFHKLTNFFKNPVAGQGTGGYNVNPVVTGLNAGGQYMSAQPGSTTQHP